MLPAPRFFSPGTARATGTAALQGLVVERWSTAHCCLCTPPGRSATHTSAAVGAGTATKSRPLESHVDHRSRPSRSPRVQSTALGNGASGAEPLEAVVIVDHGSRRAESNDMLHEFADLYRRVSGRTLVEVAHMELAAPSVADAVDAAVAAGAEVVTIAPYFLSRGRHIQDDIPALVSAAAAKHPGIRCRLAEPLGLDVLLAQLIEKRVAAASDIEESSAAIDAESIAVV